MNNNESYEEWSKKFDARIEKYEAEMDADMHNTFIDIYDNLKEDGINYLNHENNETSICLVYEAMLHFLVNEDYEKCAFIRAVLNEFATIRRKKSIRRQEQKFRNKNIES